MRFKGIVSNETSNFLGGKIKAAQTLRQFPGRGKVAHCWKDCNGPAFFSAEY